MGFAGFFFFDSDLVYRVFLFVCLFYFLPLFFPLFFSFSFTFFFFFTFPTHPSPGAGGCGGKPSSQHTVGTDSLIQKGNVSFTFEITDRHSGDLWYLRGVISFYFICWNKEMEEWFRDSIFFFFFFSHPGLFFFPLLASLFYPENLILQKNGLTLSLSSGDEINCFLIHFPPSW